MQKLLLLFFLSLLPSFSFAQLQSGFDKDRARELVWICNSFTSIDLFNSYERINPVAYPKVLKDSFILENDSLMAVHQKALMAILRTKSSIMRSPGVISTSPTMTITGS